MVNINYVPRGYETQACKMNPMLNLWQDRQTNYMRDVLSDPLRQKLWVLSKFIIMLILILILIILIILIILFVRRKNAQCKSTPAS